MKRKLPKETKETPCWQILVSSMPARKIIPFEHSEQLYIQPNFRKYSLITRVKKIYLKHLRSSSKHGKVNQGALNFNKEKPRNENADVIALLRKDFQETLTQPILSLHTSAQILTSLLGIPHKKPLNKQSSFNRRSLNLFFLISTPLQVFVLIV